MMPNTNMTMRESHDPTDSRYPETTRVADIALPSDIASALSDAGWSGLSPNVDPRRATPNDQPLRRPVIRL